MRYFVLDDDHALLEVHESNILTWQLWMQRNEPQRTVDSMEIEDDYLVSTTFMGKYDDADEPAPFMTTIFARKEDPVFTCRWRTWEEAVAGHREILVRTFTRWVIEREHEGYPIKM
jgi:hypothetical protein